MSLTDGALADLARRAADLVGADVPVRIRPPTNDDPYRWGGHGWLVTIGAADEIWIPVDATPEDAWAALRAGVAPGRAE